MHLGWTTSIDGLARLALVTSCPRGLGRIHRDQSLTAGGLTSCALAPKPFFQNSGATLVARRVYDVHLLFIGPTPL